MLKDEEGSPYDLKKFSPRRDLGKHGIGLQLYFSFLFFLFIIFVLLGLINIVSLSANIEGGGLVDTQGEPSKGTLGLGGTTLGNQFPIGNTTDGSKQTSTLFFGAVSVRKDRLSFVIGLLDAIGVVVFIIGLGCYSQYSMRAARRVDDEATTPSDYCVQVTGKPGSA